MSTLKVNELDTKSGTTITVAAGKTLAGTDIIDTAQIAANAVDTTEIAAGAVTNAKTDFQPGTTFKGDGSSADGKITLNCSQNTHGVSIQSPAHASAASYTLTLPTTDGNASEFMQTNGSGVLTWASAAAGFHNVNFVTATDTSVDLTSGTTLIVVEVQGAGGCAAGSNAPGAYGGCGAAGGYSMQQLTVVDTDTWNITIGAGGTEAGTRAGGDAVFAQASGSSLGSTITGGGGGAGNNPPGGSGTHQNGGTGGTVTNANAGAFNMVGGDGASGGLDKQGANSKWGQGGIRQVAGTGAGGNASGYGAGGGDANGASQNGGDGSDALVVIWEYR